MIEFNRFRGDEDKNSLKPLKRVDETENSAKKALEDMSPVQESGYKLYRDKAETFICDMEIMGANPVNSKARIILETRDLTYMFEGTIDGQGHCRVPLRKMNFLNENEGGTIKLEVIAEDMVFTPWQDNFVAVDSKKINVRVVESEEVKPTVGIKVSNIR